MSIVELTWISSSAANAHDSPAVNVLLPTPPLPDNTSTFRLTLFIRSRIRGKSGSGPLGPSAQTDWLGHPSQASALPACVDSIPCLVRRMLAP